MDRPGGTTLEGSEVLYKTAFDNAVMGMALADLHGCWIEVNKSFCDLVGRERGDLLGRPFREITHPDDVGRSLKGFQQLVSGRINGYDIEKRYLHKTGAPIWVLLTSSLLRDEHSRPSCLYVQINNISKRKVVEDALRRSEALFRAIAENATDLIALIDPQHRLIYSSPAHSQLLGYSAAELRDGPALSLIYPEDKQKALHTIQLTATTGHSRTHLRLRHKDGTPCDVETSGTVIRDASGQVEKYVFIARPLDERLKAEKALKEREEQLHLVLNSTAEAIYGIDMEGNCTFCNPACLRLLGYTETAELLGKNAHAQLHHSSADGSPAPVSQCRIRKALREGLCVHADDEVLWRSDGTCFPCEYWTHPAFRDGKPVGAIITFIDITERKRAEKALRSAHRESELFINSVPSILIGTDPRGQITRWNVTAANTFCLSESEVLGKSLPGCGVQWLRPDFEAEVAAWLHIESSIRCDNVAFNRRGEPRFVGLTIIRPNADHGDSAGLLITGADITERKALEEQLHQAQKLEAIGQLAAGIAHEINTPTQYVGDNTTFLKESCGAMNELLSLSRKLLQEAGAGQISPETLSRCRTLIEQTDLDYLQQEIPRALDQSLEGIQRVSKIVRAMKEFSHPGSDGKTPVDINRAIETTITVARNEWKYVAEVHTDFDHDLPLVPCYAGEFNQVVLNLLVNAAQAIASVVKQTPGAKGRIEVITRRQESWAEILIRDSGCGIPNAVRSRVFEPFFTTKEVGQGTGQGLALAHSVIVKKHGGKIWFESEVEKGTTFYVRLPLGEAIGEDQAHSAVAAVAAPSA